jgi:hypothetical protein
LPDERAPRGTATVRIGGDVFAGVIKVLEDIERD